MPTAIGLTFVMSGAGAATAPAQKGARAMLTISVQVDATGERHSRADGIDVNWSTHRTFEAKVELSAEGAQGASMTGGQVKQPGKDLQSLQKEAEKCGDDQGCMLAVAAKMMENGDVQEIMKQSEAPPRYQVWRAVEKGGRVEIKAASYVEEMNGVFLTATREDVKCRFVAPATSGALSAKDRETLTTGTRALMVEVDTQTGANKLLLGLGSYAQGDKLCTTSYEGKSQQERESKPAVFLPYIRENSGWIDGVATTAPMLARGEKSFDVKTDQLDLANHLSPKPPLKVKVRWELTKL